MTFAVVTVGENRERIVGTIWADGEHEAQQMASSVLQPEGEENQRLVVRRAEGREIPLRMMN